MRTFVPYAATDPKTRLSAVLDADERVALTRAMLGDVLDSLDACDHPAADDVTVLATDDVGLDREVGVRVDDRPLTPAVNAVLEEGPAAVVMADLALATPGALERLFRAGEGADVAVAPGRGGGTNALVVDHPQFRVDYHGASYRDHRAAAADVDARVAVVDSFRLATDVDEPADLAEVLLHGGGPDADVDAREPGGTDPGGRTAAWLRSAGFRVAVTDGRVTVGRS